MNAKRLGWLALATMVACSSSGDGQQQLPPDETIDELPVVEAPSVLSDDNPDPKIVEVTMMADVMKGTLGGDQELDLMAYNGSVPGPLLQARVGDEIIVHFTNNLAEPTTIHWHGLRVPSDMDGTPRVQNPVQPGETFTYHFVAPEAGSFWYHPHVRGYEQVERGLYGPLVIHGEHDPRYDLERYIMLDDIYLDDTGIAPFLQNNQLVHGRAGNALLINGTITEPIRGTAEQGQVERWRLVNPSNARTMEFSVSGAQVRVIGTDGGLLAHPYTTDRVVMAVGQRYDLEVAYTDPGAVELSTHVLTLNDADEVVEVALPVAHIEVVETGRVVSLPEWTAPDLFTGRETARYEQVTFDAGEDEHGNFQWMLNGKSHSEEPLFTVVEGETIKIQLKNLAGPEHPFHLHGQFFRILDGDQPGLKDTALLGGGQSIIIEAYFDNPGQWMAHCHILEHAELGMMSEIIVTPAPGL